MKATELKFSIVFSKIWYTYFPFLFHFQNEILNLNYQTQWGFREHSLEHLIPNKLMTTKKVRKLLQAPLKGISER